MLGGDVFENKIMKITMVSQTSYALG